MVAALAAGALSVAGFAPLAAFPLPFLTLAGLLLLWRLAATPRAAFRIGFAFGAGLFGAGVSWVYVSLHDFGSMPANGPMVPAQRGYLRPLGQWNFIEVTVRGPAIRVELNGTRILDADLSKVTTFKDGTHPGKDRTTGYFGFCGHSDPVALRHIQIRELEPAQKP